LHEVAEDGMLTFWFLTCISLQSAVGFERREPVATIGAADFSLSERVFLHDFSLCLS
jgi:hypothetical protein